MDANQRETGHTRAGSRSRCSCHFASFVVQTFALFTI